MKSLVACLMGLMAFVQAGATQQPTVSGQVRLSGGLPVAGAQVMLFDLADLRRGAVAYATTDESGHFALPLATLGTSLPQGFALGANYPNPFNPATIIPYELAATSLVKLEVFNTLGQRIATLVDGEQGAGAYSVRWDATDASGQAGAAGLYLYRLTVDGAQQTGRMVLVDGQAGVPMRGTSIEALPMAGSPSSAYGTYGLVVAGPGLVTYVDSDFGVEVGMGPVEFVVDATELLPRGKVVAGILGDVNNDGQVDGNDALLVMLYTLDSSITLPNNGDIRLGDVNGDGQVDEDDMRVLMAYVANPLDGALPAELGQPIGGGKQVTVASAARSVVFILDVSGSMEEEVEGGGVTRLDAAKSALSQVLRGAPTDGSQEYALTTFGESDGCSVNKPIPFTNDPQRVMSYVSGLSPTGETPLAEALLQGERLALDTASSEDILLVLLSDGEETCGGNPVAVAQQIRSRGQVRLISVNAIGFGVKRGSDADKQIEAIAQAGGGKYYRASDVEDLTAVLGHASGLTCPTEHVGARETANRIKIFRDDLPWDSNAMVDLFNALGLVEGTGADNYEILTSQEMGSVDLIPGQDLVVISNDQPQRFYDNYARNQVKFLNFVDSGGTLFWGACDEGWNSGSIVDAKINLPGGIETNHQYENVNQVLDRALPLVSGLPELLNGNRASHEWFSNLPGGTVIYTIGSDSGKPTLIEFNQGAGWVILSGQPLEWGYDRRDEYSIGLLLDRIVAYVLGVESQAGKIAASNPLRSVVDRDRSSSEVR